MVETAITNNYSSYRRLWRMCVLLMAILLCGCKSSPIENYLPEDFRKLSFQTTLDELKEARPYIKTSGRGGEAAEELSEESASSLLTHITSGDDDELGGCLGTTIAEYKFKDNKLSEISFTLSMRSCSYSTLKRAVRERLEKLLGDDYKEREPASNWRSLTLWWEKDDANIRVKIPNKHRRIYYTISAP